ncbi:MAG: hypothetical protein ACLR5H_14620 [Oscillospiraceae bacterium]
MYGLQQGLRDPTGWQADIRFTQYYSGGDAPMRPEAGKRYLLLACTYDDTGVGGAMRNRRRNSVGHQRAAEPLVPGH